MPTQRGYLRIPPTYSCRSHSSPHFTQEVIVLAGQLVGCTTPFAAGIRERVGGLVGRRGAWVGKEEMKYQQIHLSHKSSGSRGRLFPEVENRLRVGQK